jgi:hypothetical protein
MRAYTWVGLILRQIGFLWDHARDNFYLFVLAAWFDVLAAWFDTLAAVRKMQRGT